MEPGEIRTDELLLRPWRPSDAEAVHQACRDPLLAAMSHLPVPFPYADAPRFVADMAALTAQDRAVALGVFDTTGDKLLAAVDLRGLDLRRAIEEDGRRYDYWIGSVMSREVAA